MDPITLEIAKFIEQRTGIKPDAVGNSSWNRAIRRRMEITELDSLRAYQLRLMSLPVELQELVELIIVPETWFFRDRASLDFLATYIKAKGDMGHAKPWRILSLACATGEEVYSIAMALLDVNLPATAFQIEGVDISKKALEVARKGIYGSNSFRNKATLMHKGHFDKVGNDYSVHGHLKQCVKFLHANIMSPHFVYARRKYDIIFCRNVLIYFNTPSQNQVFDLCEQMLAEAGVLVLGPTESELARLAGFEGIGPRNACAFHRRSKTSISPRKAFQELAAANRQMEITAAKATLAQKDFLEKASHNANEGKIQESIELCKRYLEQYDGDAEIYHLLGTLHIAAKNDELAAYYLEKALYLDPNHYDVLVSLALITERNGKAEQAELLWRRARKQFAMAERSESEDQP